MKLPAVVLVHVAGVLLNFHYFVAPPQTSVVVQAWTSLPVHSRITTATSRSASRNNHKHQYKHQIRRVFRDTVPRVLLSSSSFLSNENANNNTSGLGEASYDYEDYDEDTVDEDSVLASILQDQRLQQQLQLERLKEDQDTEKDRPKTPSIKSLTNATTAQNDSGAKLAAIKTRHDKSQFDPAKIKGKPSQSNKQQQQKELDNKNKKQPPMPPKKASIVPQPQQILQPKIQPLLGATFAANKSDNEDRKMANTGTNIGTNNDRALITHSSQDINQQVPLVLLQATNNTDTILRQVDTCCSDIDTKASPDTDTWEKPIYETSINDTVVASKERDNKIDPALSSLILDRPASLSSTIINPYRNVALANKTSESTSKTAANETNKMVATADASSTSSPAIPKSNQTFVDIKSNRQVVATATMFASPTPVVPNSNGTTIINTKITRVASTPRTSAAMMVPNYSNLTTTTISTANEDGAATLAASPLIPKSNLVPNVNTDQSGTLTSNCIPPAVLKLTANQSSNEQVATVSKPSSIWSKLGIPSKRPVNDRMLSIPKNHNSEKASPSSGAVVDDKSNSDKKQTAKEKKITFWSSLVHDLHTAPTIVVPVNASWSANSIRDSTASSVRCNE